MSLMVSSAGILSLMQDFGRYGLQKKGITHGGPMDEHAFLWANRLLANPYTAAQLEISFGGFAGHFTKETMIAVCGADLSATLNGQPLSLWQSHYVQAGDEIRFASPKSGSRAYLAAKQGFTVPLQLSSAATVLRESLGGLHSDGQKIAKGEEIPYSASGEETSRYTPFEFIPEYKKQLQLRFIPNRSVTGCSDEAIATLIKQPFTVSSQMDRMGYRLEGEPIQHKASGIISQGISLGAIQLPKDGQPIVLMKDHQTMGGYPQLGCVAYLDLAALAQALPGTEVRFSAVEIADLEEELMQYKQFFHLNH